MRQQVLLDENKTIRFSVIKYSSWVMTLKAVSYVILVFDVIADFDFLDTLISAVYMKCFNLKPVLR